MNDSSRYAGVVESLEEFVMMLPSSSVPLHGVHLVRRDRAQCVDMAAYWTSEDQSAHIGDIEPARMSADSWVDKRSTNRLLKCLLRLKESCPIKAGFEIWIRLVMVGGKGIELRCRLRCIFVCLNKI